MPKLLFFCAVATLALAPLGCGAGGNAGGNEAATRTVRHCADSFNQALDRGEISLQPGYVRIQPEGATAYVATWQGSSTYFRPRGACLLALADSTGQGMLFSEATIPGQGRSWIPVSEPIPAAPPSGLELSGTVQLALIQLAHRSPNVELDPSSNRLTVTDASAGPVAIDPSSAARIRASGSGSAPDSSTAQTDTAATSNASTATEPLPSGASAGECGTVQVTPNTDEQEADVRVAGLTCSDAKAALLAWATGGYKGDGPPGFQCDSIPITTGYGGAKYHCTQGDKALEFTSY